MRIDKVSISGFGGFASEESFDLSGDVTVIVGPNGAGKSTVYEAVSAALFQRSIRTNRGIKMFHDAGGTVKVFSNGEEYSLTRSADQGSFKNAKGCSLVSFERWKLGAVFERGAWVAAPTKLVDMLSAILDLEKINKALLKVKAQHSDAKNAVSRIEGAISSTEAFIQKAEEDANKEVPIFDEKELKSAQKQLKQLQEKKLECKKLQAEISDLKDDLAKIPKVLKECPTCKRPFDVKDDSCRDELVIAAKTKLSAAQLTLSKLDPATVDSKLSSVNLKIRRLEEFRESSRNAQAAVAAAESTAAEGRGRLAAQRGEHKSAQQRATLLAEAVRVLGPRGLPGFLLETELETISDIAAEYAVEINPSATLSVSYGDKGIVIDASYGASNYDSCSEGEKRAIDLALFFAFATIANPNGTIFLDEAFDCLDAECAYRAIRLCSKLPFNVVLLTHSENVLAATPNAKIYNL